MGCSAYWRTPGRPAVRTCSLYDGRHSDPRHVLTVQVMESEPDDQTHSKRRQGKAHTASKDMRSRRVILNNPPNRNARTGSYRGKTALMPMHNAYTWHNPGGPIGSPAGHQTAGYATAKSDHAGKPAGTNLSLIHI